MINCTFENGNKASLRHVTVGAIVVNDSNQILLTKRASNLLRGDKYTIPGGFMDRDETSKEAVLRELLEETGLNGEIRFLFKIEDRPERLNEQGPEGRQNIDFVYVVKVFEGNLKDNSEVSEIKWFAEDSIPSVEEFAFDHHDVILKYFEFLKKPFSIPIVGGLS